MKSLHDVIAEVDALRRKMSESSDPDTLAWLEKQSLNQGVPVQPESQQEIETDSRDSDGDAAIEEDVTSSETVSVESPQVETETLAGVDPEEFPEGDSIDSVNVVQPESEIDPVTTEDHESFQPDDIDPMQIDTEDLEDAPDVTFQDVEVPGEPVLEDDEEVPSEMADAGYPPEMEEVAGPQEIEAEAGRVESDEPIDTDFPDSDVETVPQYDEDATSDVAAVEAPDVVSAEMEQSDSPEEMPQSELAESPDFDDDVQDMSFTQAEEQKTGFQGFVDHGDVSESQLDFVENPSMTFEQKSEKQMEMQMQSNQHLASEMADQLGPMFTDMRNENEQVIHDVMARETLLTSIFRQRI